jgi:hypothetical protein
MYSDWLLDPDEARGKGKLVPVLESAVLSCLELGIGWLMLGNWAPDGCAGVKIH